MKARWERAAPAQPVSGCGERGQVSSVGVCVQNSQGRASSSWGASLSTGWGRHSWGGVQPRNRKFSRGSGWFYKTGTEASAGRGSLGKGAPGVPVLLLSCGRPIRPTSSRSLSFPFGHGRKGRLGPSAPRPGLSAPPGALGFHPGAQARGGWVAVRDSRTRTPADGRRTPPAQGPARPRPLGRSAARRSARGPPLPPPSPGARIKAHMQAMNYQLKGVNYRL